MGEYGNITKETVEDLTISINKLRASLQDRSNMPASMAANSTFGSRNDDILVEYISRKAAETTEALNCFTNAICANTKALNRNNELIESYMQLMHEQREQETRTECEQEAQTKSGDFEWPEIL